LRRGVRTVLYLSASIANGPLNTRLREHLPESRFELILPQEFAPVAVSHPSYPRAIYERCIAEMERCDAGLILLDAFAVDCASEAGWFAARGKPLIGVAGGSLRFLQHWMVKGNLTGVISMDATVHQAIAADPILASCPARLCAGWPELGDAVATLLGERHDQRADGQDPRARAV
jgi:nucleoside 2-deoxyribosyltransferase